MKALAGPAGAASATSLGMMAAAELGKARNARSGANGSFSWMTTVYLSVAVTESTDLKAVTPRDPTLPQRLREAVTSSAVISLPLWNGTARRRRIVYVRPSL